MVTRWLLERRFQFRSSVRLNHTRVLCPTCVSILSRSILLPMLAREAKRTPSKHLVTADKEQTRYVNPEEKDAGQRNKIHSRDMQNPA